MVPPSNDNKTTYTLSLGWLLKLVVIICSFWLLLIIRVQTRGKNYKKKSPNFRGPTKFFNCDLGCKNKTRCFAESVRATN